MTFSQDTNTPPAFANETNPGFSIATDKLLFVQSVVVDGKDRVWALDTGRPRVNGSVLLAATPGGPKLVGFDLNGTRIATFTFPTSVVAADSSLNDVRFDLRGDGYAYITDSSLQRAGIVVINLTTGESWRHLDGHPSVTAQSGFITMHNGSEYYFIFADVLVANFHVPTVPIYIHPPTPPNAIAFFAPVSPFLVALRERALVHCSAMVFIGCRRWNRPF